MFVSKIKPCMCKYKLLNGKTANGSLKQLYSTRFSIITWITLVILVLIHGKILVSEYRLLDKKPTQFSGIFGEA